MSKKRIRRTVRENRYEFTRRALDEMDDDNLTETDVRQVLLQGDIEAELSDDYTRAAFCCAWDFS